MKDKLTVVVSSCDSYEDVWYPFFFLYSENWPKGRALDIILNTESKQFSFPGLNIRVSNSKKAAWGYRLKKALRSVNTEYVLCLLEDFFFGDVVCHEYLQECINLMDENKNIACINLQKPTYGNNTPSPYNWLDRRKNGDEYTLSCQPALWRRKFLLKLINSNATPWQFEVYGSPRTALYPQKVFYILSEKAPNVFGYDWYGLDGCGIHGGKWQKGTPQLFERYGIDMDFSVRGFVGDQLSFGALTRPKRDFLDMRMLIKTYIHTRGIK